MPDYIVKKPCRPEAEPKLPGDEVTLTQRQAKYLLMSGHLEPKPAKGKARKADSK